METKQFYVDTTLYKGRPEQAENRLEKEIRVYDLLDSLGIEYERADHDTADTIEDCEKVEEIIGVDICKNLFLCNRQMTKFYMLMMPGKKPFKTKDISQQIGSARLSFAPAEKMMEYLDITPGSVSIMGLMNDKNCEVQLLLDREIAQSEYVRCHPCINTSTLKIKTSDIIEKYLPAVKHNYVVVDLPNIVE
ncbi:MAG: prolyl-tRNA synthetase associated domain-containing protein [Clostridia bacterium]|jgi:Ala-tRNA(Pro) deacylase|nr:prolyl-tRNA synthetase associated domain-containing protein [Clostridia bacterium]